MQRCQRRQLPELADQLVVDDSGPVELRPAAPPGADGHHPEVVQVLPASATRSKASRAASWSATAPWRVIGVSPSRSLAVEVSLPMRSTMPSNSDVPDSGATSWYFSEEDPVEDEDGVGHGHGHLWAWIAVMATV